MKFGTRLSVYYGLTSIIAMFIVGLIATITIHGIWMNTVIDELTEQNARTQNYIKQVILLDNPSNDNLSTTIARSITGSLSPGIGQIQLYDEKMSLLSGLVDVFEQDGFIKQRFKQDILEPASQGNTVKEIHNNVYYYASPIIIDSKQVGTLVINYKLGLLDIILSKIVYILIFGAACFSLIILLLSMYISRKMVNPIKELVSVTHSYAQRDFPQYNNNRQDELGQLAESINDMGMQLKDHIERQKQFVSNVSHELRTPLTAIRGYSEYLAEELYDRQDLEKPLFHLINETDRLSSLVNDLLQMSRMDSYQEKYHFREINLSDILKSCIDNMNQRANRKGLAFNTHINPDVFISGDSEKLIQVFVNILDNAIKYSTEASAIDVFLHKEDVQAVVVITDYGTGIPEDSLQKIFDRFYRASNVAGISGNGLGLAISKEIISMHSGSISAENAAHGGAKFTMTFPIVVTNLIQV